MNQPYLTSWFEREAYLDLGTDDTLCKKWFFGEKQDSKSQNFVDKKSWEFNWLCSTNRLQNQIRVNF